MLWSSFIGRLFGNLLCITTAELVIRQTARKHLSLAPYFDWDRAIIDFQAVTICLIQEFENCMTQCPMITY